MSNIAADDGIPEITLGWRLRIAMERAGLKAEDMAAQLGVHRGTITRWTHDIGKPPRAIYLHRWADLCHVKYAWLAGEHARPTDIAGGVGAFAAGSDRRKANIPTQRERRRNWNAASQCLIAAAIL
jgi:transcriptional regulator with XRE-family HTH domain